jgi:hypothetical protein
MKLQKKPAGYLLDLGLIGTGAPTGILKHPLVFHAPFVKTDKIIK